MRNSSSHRLTRPDLGSSAILGKTVVTSTSRNQLKPGVPRYSRPGAADTSATATNRRVNPAAKKSSEVNVVNIPGSMLMGLTKSKVVTSQTAAM